MPGEAVLLASGALAHRGVLDPVVVLFFGLLGAVTGDQIGYWIGRKGGRPFVLRWGRYVMITPERLGRTEAYFARHGGRAVFFARFVAGLRVFGALVAGISRMPWRRVVLYNVLGGVASDAAGGFNGFLPPANTRRVGQWVRRVSLPLGPSSLLSFFLRLGFR